MLTAGTGNNILGYLGHPRESALPGLLLRPHPARTPSHSVYEDRPQLI